MRGGGRGLVSCVGRLAYWFARGGSRLWCAADVWLSSGLHFASDHALSLTRVRWACTSIQGYLAHKKLPPPLGPP